MNLYSFNRSECSRGGKGEDPGVSRGEAASGERKTCRCTSHSLMNIPVILQCKYLEHLLKPPPSDLSSSPQLESRPARVALSRPGRALAGAHLSTKGVVWENSQLSRCWEGAGMCWSGSVWWITGNVRSPTLPETEKNSTKPGQGADLLLCGWNMEKKRKRLCQKSTFL